MLKPLPIGIQTFRKIVEGGYLYVDKTQLIYSLIRNPSGVYFLSRPRRFGKSLLISTLEEIFLGNKELFQGLWLHDSDYTWPAHPLIRFDFSLERVQSAARMEEVIGHYLEEIAWSYDLELIEGSYQRQFRWLIQQLAKQERVVILIDEYDYPIIDNIENPAIAAEVRDVLKGFYTVIKAMDRYVRFVLLTGISKFSRVGVFSGLNNLQDISMNSRYAALPGITQTELESEFSQHLENFAKREVTDRQELLAKIKEWYNGFKFSEEGDPVYNPFSLLLLFETSTFRNYWFETGSPTFLMKLLRDRNYDLQQLQRLQVSEMEMSTYEIDQLQLIPLLFQTGYLTIKEYDTAQQLYTLYFPNYEVEDAFLAWLLNTFSYVRQGLQESHLWQLVDALKADDLTTFFDVLKVFFAQIPYGLQINQERYYQSIFYIIFTLICLRLDAERQTNRGRIDAVIELPQT
ncbi:MAG: AAA family ATPase, partial [Caldilineaceae bacterium]|nr:AAA family ATPase [Caldilineaceae bacterium]